MKRKSKKLIAAVLMVCTVLTMNAPAYAAMPNRLPGGQFDQYYQNPQANQNSILPGLDDVLSSMNNWFWNMFNPNGSNSQSDDNSGTDVGTSASTGTDANTETNTSADTGSTSSGATVTPPTTSSATSDTTTTESSYAAGTLRATTMTLASSGATPYANTSDSTVLKYFPVTLYDYDENIINAATMTKETSGTLVYEGIYFNDGDPNYNAETTADLSAFIAGQYYIQNIRAAENNVDSWLVGDTNGITSTTQSDATLWTLEVEGGSYYLKSGDYYLSIGTGQDGDGLTTTKTAVSISAFSGNSEGVQLYQNGYYLCQWGSTTATEYGGYNVNNDGGNAMRFYRVYGGTQTLTVPGENVTTVYEAWNCWDKATGNVDNGQKTYTGLVESTLDANKDIVFTKPEGGIFNSDATVKSIYTNVELPFVYENGTYTFDASQNGVYFWEDETQSSDGTAASNTRLYFDETPQSWEGMNYGDGSTNLWAPFDDNNLTSEASVNYHFGLRATVPFTMTANGCMDPDDDSSDHITFSFSGDDDVWIFIDGQLIGDLGGIHNRLDVDIDFADNTVIYSANNSVTAATGSYNDSNFALKQTLFGGLISQDRVTFAATDSHELTIFYLERGKGSSNCQIKFNLPMKDTVTVTKHATQSWTDDGSDEGKVTPLTAAEQAVVDNIDFGFTLYKSTDNGSIFTVVANTNYNLMNANGQVISTPSTDANGHFYLKNGQSARFVTEFAAKAADGTTGDTTYYVVEDSVASLGFVMPDYNFGGESAGGFSANATDYANGSDIPEQILSTNAESNKSYEVTVYGSDESEDSVVFICENYLDAELPNPSARPAEDKIVIDYGLGVEIDVLANDLYRGNSIELVSVTGAGVVVDEGDGTVKTEGAAPAYGTVEVKNGKITYRLTKQLTGVEVLNYVVKVTGETDSAYAVGVVYIIPATSLYYEEDFTGLVTYTGSGWQAGLVTESAYTNATQEPGVVGTVGDSPYGSDVAYLNDSHDSNGTSKYANTTNGAVQFSYTFTGTGTSFFARTSNTSGSMKIVVTDESNNVLETYYRNTVYKDQASDVKGPLYNIPVYTWEADAYGTYKVSVSIAGKTTIYGPDFWLDGIRVVNPLNSNDANAAIANSAYASDAEANMSVVTLRDKMLSSTWTEGQFVVFTDIDGKVKTAEDYTSIGPKEELYAYDGQSVKFTLDKWDPNTNEIYLGMKAPAGSAVVTINGTSVTLNNAADCYYLITDYATITTTTTTDSTTGISTIVNTAEFTITAGEKTLVSLTNIKVTGNDSFDIISQGVDYYYDDYSGDDEDPQTK